MFRPNVDYSGWHERLLTQGRVQIPDILDDDFSAKIHAALAAEKEWALAYRDGDEAREIEHGAYAAMDPLQRAKFVSNVIQSARGRYAYVYENYSMIQRFHDEGRSEHLLRQLVHVFNFEPILDFIRQLTGDAEIQRVRIQATRYQPGHFLRRHDDAGYDDQHRRIAFVFNFSRGWQADWGGLLHFVDAQGKVVDTFVPWFNSLSLFKVPQFHYVSQVTAWAETPRYALTGWFTS